jgi:hypothetical protein
VCCGRQTTLRRLRPGRSRQSAFTITATATHRINALDRHQNSTHERFRPLHTRANRPPRGKPRRGHRPDLEALRRLNRPENWRVRNKLTAVVLLPGLLAGVMAVMSL